MSYELFLSLAILASLVLYALSGGADFGGGVWDLFASGRRAQAQRDAIDRAIGPIWEANHVWLIVVIVLVFTGFPPAFGAIMTTLHVPMTIVLLGIVLRASAFVFRKYDAHSDAVNRRWSSLFGIASLLTPFFLGLCLGALGSGEIRVENGRVESGFFSGWTRPFALGCGLFAELLFAFLAATYMTVETEREPVLCEIFRRRALGSGLSLVPLAAIVLLFARRGAPTLFAGFTDWWTPWLLAATVLCAMGALLALQRRRFALARIGAVGQVALIVIGWGLAQYPWLVVPDLTFANTAASPATLRLLAGSLVAGGALLFPSFVYLFHVFKGAQRQRK